MKLKTFFLIAFILLAFVFFIAGAGVIQAQVSSDPSHKTSTTSKGEMKSESKTMNSAILLQKHFTSKGINYSSSLKMFGSADAPIASFISEKNKTDLSLIHKNFVLSGKNWSKTLSVLKQDPSFLFPSVPSGYSVPSPFATAYMLHRKNLRSASALSGLSTSDFNNLILLNVIHEHFNIPVSTIMNERKAGKSFDDIIKTEYSKSQRKGSTMMDGESKPSVTINKENYEIKNVKCPPWKSECCDPCKPCDPCSPVCAPPCPPVCASPSPSPEPKIEEPPQIIEQQVEEVIPEIKEVPVTPKAKPQCKVKVKGCY